MSDLTDKLDAIAISEADAIRRGLRPLAGPYFDPRELLAAAKQKGGEGAGVVVVRANRQDRRAVWKIYASEIATWRTEFNAGQKRERGAVRVDRRTIWTRGADGRRHPEGREKEGAA